jgi:Zn ribbon nucleic-acid-binding protein
MDFMFEDDVDEVGSDVEAYCPKCKADTTHVVISKYEDEIRRVQCNPCGDVHSFRKPRGEAEEDMPEPVAARKRALLKKLTWEEFFAKHGERNAKPYEFRDTYRENAIVFHPKFGKGYVSEVVSESKVEITFPDARRILVHNRKDIPGSPVGREDDGLPSTPAPVKTSSKAAAKATEKQAAKQAAVPKSAPVTNAPAKKSEEKEPHAKKPAVKATAPATKAPVAKKPVVKKPAKPPVAKKPAAKKALAKKPAAKKAEKKKHK